jgi:hypothetical protein
MNYQFLLRPMKEHATLYIIYDCNWLKLTVPFLALKFSVHKSPFVCEHVDK